MSDQARQSGSGGVKTIFIFRHGETEWNRAGRFQGSTDIPLNEKGREQARRLTQFFAENPVDVFLSSDLSRAVETAKIASGSMNSVIIQDMRLRETNMGKVEGLTEDEVIRLHGTLLDEWRRFENSDVRFPDGESKREHLERLLEGLEAFADSTPHARIGVASHGGALRRLIHHLRPELDQLVMVGNCFVYKFQFDPTTRQWHVEPEPVCS